MAKKYASLTTLQNLVNNIKAIFVKKTDLEVALSGYDKKGSAEAVQTNLNTVSDTLNSHTTNSDIHFTAAERTKLSGIQSGAQVNTVTGVKGSSESTYRTGNINITKANIGLGNVDNTADSAKSVKHATSADSATSATKATQDGNGKVISSTYETKTDAASKLTEAKNYADNAANAVKNDLLNNAGAAYDTLKELGDLIDDNKDAIDALEDIAAGKANTIHIHPYGVCSSSATYTTKTVTVDNFSLVEGVRVIVKFTNANKASSPKLNVNETGAIPIVRYGTAAAGSNVETNGWDAGAVLAFTYDGTNWVMDYWYNTTYTNAKLGQGYGTCYTSTSVAEKEVSMTGYEDKTGGIVSIKFTYSVDAGATLNINGQGALDIYYNGSAIVDDVIKGGDVATFINSGSSYCLISVDRWHEDIVALQSSESKVKQTETVANGNFSLLLAPSDINGTEYRYTYYADGIYANPSLKRIYADIKGSSTGVRDVAAGNFLVGNGTETMVEKTPAEVLEMIGSSKVQMITWEDDD